MTFDQSWKLAVDAGLVDEYAEDLTAEEGKLRAFLAAGPPVGVDEDTMTRVVDWFAGRGFGYDSDATAKEEARSVIAAVGRSSSATPGVTEAAREALLALAAICHGDVPERHAPEVWAQVIKAHDLLLAALAGSPTVLTPRSAAPSPAPTDYTRWQRLTAEEAIAKLEERLASSRRSGNVLRAHIVAAMMSNRGNSQAILLRALAVAGFEPRRPKRARRRARRLLLQAAEILEDGP